LFSGANHLQLPWYSGIGFNDATDSPWLLPVVAGSNDQSVQKKPHKPDFF
jgi:hypothetical protein